MKIINIILTMLLTISAPISANTILKNLDKQMVNADSLVCVGLDPDASKMPLDLHDEKLPTEENIYNFLTVVVDITAEHVCCYKIQKAFFDQYEQGHTLFNRVIAYIHKNHPQIPVFADCKIGDIDNTMLAYMHRLFDEAKIDGVVINPYMGDDVFEPFIQDPEKVAIVLVQTSNKNAGVVQEIVLKNERQLWEEVLELTMNRWNKNGNLIPVLSSNAMCDYAQIRKKIPQETPILLAGIGTQGGDPSVMKQLLNAQRRGVFVNSSRGILYPYTPSAKNWKEEILKATLELKQKLNAIRQG